MPKECLHEKFAARVAVARITDGEDGPLKGFYAEITVSCVQCETPFHFVGLPYGLTPDQPRTSPDALEARMPIAPGPKAIAASGKMTFEVM